MRDPLQSDNPLVLVHELSKGLAEEIRRDNDLGGAVVANKLIELRDGIWPLNRKPLEVSAKRRLFKHVIDELNDNQKDKLYEAYARLGQMYEIAGLAARHNYFKKQVAWPAGVKEFYDKQPDAETAVNRLNQPVFEVTMTMHPTNTHSLDSMRAQRELSKALESGDEAAVNGAIRHMAHTPVLHQENGKDGNFTVRDETAVVVNYLENIYEDVTAIYKKFDGMQKRFGDAYHPEDLKLNIRLGSWGSAGDKDGNQNVTAETTLEALTMHMTALIARYRHDLNEIKDPTLAGWKDKLTRAKEELERDILGEVSRLRQFSNEVRLGHQKDITARQLAMWFDELETRVSNLYRSLDAEGFKATLLDSYQRTKNQLTLDLLRKVRLFGFEFAKIEYRETAEEYQRVIGELVPGYSGLYPLQKTARLTDILQHEGEANRLFQQRVDQIIDEGAAQPYNKTSALPIAYHTMKRMDLARDFPNMIKDNVLAECGRLKGGPFSREEIAGQGVANLLEAQFMQRMMPEKEGRVPHLGIIPLFEEPDTMMNIDNIMRAAYDNPAYSSHMQKMAELRQEPLTQQVQIAHSDNARRSGLLAARAFIHEAHKKMRILNEEKGVRTQFFEGGSISDAYRNGVRAVSASVNAFDLHDFGKFTFQGGDLVNYFSAPSSTVRLFTRNITQMASRFERKDGEWHIRKRSAMRKEDDPKERNNKRRPNPVMEEVAVQALKDTLADYQREDFRNDRMGVLLAVLGYNEEISAGTRGSRASARVGSEQSADPEAQSTHSIEPVDIEKIRTIGFSEAWQHAGIVPTWFGAQHLGDHLLKRVVEKNGQITAKAQRSDAENQFLQVFKGANPASEGLMPQQLKMLFDKSPTFRDAQDRSAFGLAMTDRESIDWIRRRLGDLNSINPDDENIKSGIKYMAQVEKTYDCAAELAFASLTGKQLPANDEREAISSALENLKRDMQCKADFRDFLMYAKLRGRRHPLTDHQRGVLHNAGDIVVHGRFLAADDPAYGEARAKETLATIG